MFVIATVEVEVRSSSVSVVYVVRLRIVFSKAALQKRGFHGTPSGSATALEVHRRTFNFREIFMRI